MAENQLNRQLAAGIRAAQQGNSERARELLEGVLRSDRNNEQAWIWMASVVESQRERRMSLERVLKANPGNRPAQEALNSMVGVLGDGPSNIDYAAISAAANTPIPSGRRGGDSSSSATPRSNTDNSGNGGSNLVPILGFLAVVLIAIFLAITFLPQFQAPEPEPTLVAQVDEVTEEVVATIDPDYTPPPPTIQPSPTFSGTLVTVTREATLPPTFTPTVEPTATSTDLPTATLPAGTNYNFIVLGIQGSARPAIYNLRGGNAGLNNLLSNVNDIDFDPETGLLVYTQQLILQQPEQDPATPIPDTDVVASITAEPTQSSVSGIVVSPLGETPELIQSQMFLTNINDLSTVVEITSSALPNAFSPSISPDGRSVAFASNNDGDFEIYLYDIDTGLSIQLTENSGFIDTDPDWNPTGDKLVFSSDRATPARNELFTLDPFANDIEASVVRVTDSRGNNIQPQWSPVSDEIVYLNVNGESMGIRLTTESGASVRELTTQSSWLYTSPSWTSDGNYVLYTSAVDESQAFGVRLFAPQTRIESTIELENFSVIQIVER